MSISEENFPLYLSDNPIRFEPLSTATTVAIFYDDANRQVFTVRSNGAAGVIVKGPDSKTNFTCRLDDHGEITSMRFSNDMKILAIQRSSRSVDYVNFFVGGDTTEYSQTCKGKGTKIMGFCWTALYEIVYITDHGVEQYQVIPEKKMLKLLKTFSLPVNWFVWSLETSVLLVSSGSLGNTIHPFLFKQGAITRLTKFDMELSVTINTGQRCVDQRDVTMAVIYDQLYIIQLPSQQSTAPVEKTVTEDVIMYLIKDTVIHKSDVLKVNASGRFSMSVVDNIVIIHHMTLRMSLVFDIRLACEVKDDIFYHQSFIPALPVSAYKLPLPVLASDSSVAQLMYCELYSQTCVVFQPDVVLDAKLGYFWYLRLKLEPFLALVNDKCRLMDVLLMRCDSKSTVLTLCGDILSSQNQSSLTVVSSVFNKINRIYHSHIESQNNTGSVLCFDATSYRLDMKHCPVIDQSDMYTHVFTAFDQNKGASYKFVVGVLLEYIRSLSFYQIPVQHYLYELIITTLVQHSCFYQLHQFLQYHVLSDSKHLACALLSLEGAYPPAYQLALDMMKRLQTANESIVEVLLSKKQLLTALRFVQSVGLSEQILARKYLEVARSLNCPMTYFTVFRFFEQRNLRQRNNVRFLPGDRCEQYIEHFKHLFPEAAS